MSERIANQMVIYELNPEERRAQLRRVVQENVLGGRVCGGIDAILPILG